MKKVISSLTIIMLVLTIILPTCVLADSFNLSATLSKTQLAPGDEVTLTLKLQNIDMGESGMNAVEAKLEYDEDIFEKVTEDDVNGASAWSITYNDEDTNPDKGKMLAMTLKAGVKVDTTIGTITFRVKNQVSNDAINAAKPIKLKNITGNNGVELISDTDKTINYTVGVEIPGGEETVTINKTSATISVNESVQLQAQSSKGATITWTSSNSNVATVNSSGLVVGKSAGTATITAAGESKSATCTVTVTDGTTPTPPPSTETITINKTTASVKVDETVQLQAQSSKGATITWTSSGTDVATVSSTGLVTGKKVGTTTITARGESATATCQVTVYPKDSDNPSDGSFTDLSNLKFSVEQPTKFNRVNLILNNFTPKDGSTYYAYVTQNGSYTFDGSYTNLPKERTSILFDEKKSEYYINVYDTSSSAPFGARLITEETKDAYLVIIERNSENGYKMVLNPTKIEKPTVKANLGGGYIESFHYDKTQSYFSNGVEFSGSRTVTYKIGEVKDNSILASIAKEESGSFSRLLAYAKADTAALGTGSFSFGDSSSYTTDNVAVKTGKISSGKYYYVYEVADTEDGKYVPVEDVVVFNGYDDGTFTHFAFAGSTSEEGKDPTTSGGEIPQTGTKEIIAVATISVVALSGIGAFIGYKRSIIK